MCRRCPSTHSLLMDQSTMVVSRVLLATAILLSCFSALLLIAPAEVCHPQYCVDKELRSSLEAIDQSSVECRLVSLKNIACERRDVRPSASDDQFCFKLPEVLWSGICLISLTAFLCIHLTTMAVATNSSYQYAMLWILEALELSLALFALSLLDRLHSKWYYRTRFGRQSVSDVEQNSGQSKTQPGQSTDAIDWQTAGLQPIPNIPEQWFVAYVCSMIVLFVLVVNACIQPRKRDRLESHAQPRSNEPYCRESDTIDAVQTIEMQTTHEEPPPKYHTLFPESFGPFAASSVNSSDRQPKF
ncbi:unnamed protein product [Soboliphyme baturini]|uniref:Transmembrane protein n=1 Tax=Soboliphyme baturini TaxID=241478 RepID=A0A183J0U7_9BILA|nr:unnamed protein product [Soboliphyme baturini]